MKKFKSLSRGVRVWIIFTLYAIIISILIALLPFYHILFGLLAGFIGMMVIENLIK